MDRGYVKKLQTVITLAFVVISVLVCSQTAVSVKAAPNYKKIYGNLLKKSTITTCNTGESYRYTYKPRYFTMVDIDRNGTKELIVSSNKCDWHIYTIKNNKLKHLFSRRWMGSREIYYNKSAKALVLEWSEGTGLLCRVLYKIQKGKIVEALHLDSSYNSFARKTRYSLNGKACSKSKYNKYKKKYFTLGSYKTGCRFKNAKLYSFKKNTSSNRSRLLK